MTTTNERDDVDPDSGSRPNAPTEAAPGRSGGTPSPGAPLDRSAGTPPTEEHARSDARPSAGITHATPGAPAPAPSTTSSSAATSADTSSSTSSAATSPAGADVGPGADNNTAAAGAGEHGVPARAAGKFRDRFGRDPVGVWSAPGRVNLIGEHTDYNDGFVLPFALPYRIAVAAAPRTDGVLAITTVGGDGRPQQAEPVRIAELAPRSVDGWAAYPSGVAWVLRDEGFTTGADLVIAGDVPAGAGLSSSHALQCATALALLGLGGVELDEPTAPDRATVARWVQRSENDFVGVPTGLLDQTASLSCVESHVLFLDVRSGEMEQVPFDTSSSGLAVLVIDTKAKHAHSESGYGERRAGCERAATLLGLPALRDVSERDLDDALARLPDDLRPLVRHVVTENARVERTVEHLRRGDIGAIGDLLTASHVSLRDDYRVSCLELDVAVDAAIEAGALGARMTGGGFGGSAIALVREDDRESVGQRVLAAFADRGLAAPGLFTAVPSPGAGRDS